jgi:enoyl-CoA hydratase/carnithine racemase
LATQNAIISFPELQHGWLPGWGGMIRAKRLIGEARAKELVLLSKKINAAKAFEIGLLHEVSENMETMDAVFYALCEQLKNMDMDIFALAKKSLGGSSKLDAGFDVLATHFARNKKLF